MRVRGFDSVASKSGCHLGRCGAKQSHNRAYCSLGAPGWATPAHIQQTCPQLVIGEVVTCTDFEGHSSSHAGKHYIVYHNSGIVAAQAPGLVIRSTF